MKKITLLIYIIFFYSCISHQGNGNQPAIVSLPSFDMLLLDGVTLLHMGNIQTGKPILLIYFRPDCPHCQAETKSFIENSKVLRKFRIYFLTSASIEDTKGYLQQYHLDQYKNITVGQDHHHSFFKIFKPSSIPYLAIYDNQLRLVKIYYGEIPVDVLVSAV